MEEGATALFPLGGSFALKVEGLPAVAAEGITGQQHGR